jgi:2-dehydro-3-deoxygluconokinase
MARHSASQDGAGGSPAALDGGLEVFDRIGGGDSFVCGLTYGLLEGLDVDTALAFGIAHGALAMTTPGDTHQC